MLNPRNILRSNRRTLELFISPAGELVVKAPMNLPDRKIYDFVKSKEEWIIARQRRTLQNSYINRSVVSYNSFYFLGKEFVPVISNKVKIITKSDGALLIPTKFDQSKILKKIEKWFRENAKIVITERMQYFSQILRLSFSEININNNKSRWGSCSKKNQISINWRAVMLAPNLLDYIVVHEFCHILEFNHTRNFWSVVETILPDWRSRRKILKQMNWLLQLFREDCYDFNCVV